MTKVTFKRKYLIRGLLTVSEGAFMTIMVWSMTIDRHYTRAVDKSLYPDLQVRERDGGRERETQRSTGMAF